MLWRGHRFACSIEVKPRCCRLYSDARRWPWSEHARNLRIVSKLRIVLVEPLVKLIGLCCVVLLLEFMRLCIEAVWP